MKVENKKQLAASEDKKKVAAESKLHHDSK